MRLLVANYHARPVGGVETYLRAVLPRLASGPYRVGLLTREGGDPGDAGVPVSGVQWLPDAGDTPEALVATAARWQPDVIYTHGLGEPSFEAALAARFPTVAFMHNYGATCASGMKRHRAPDVTPCARPLGVACLALWAPRQCGGHNPLKIVQMYGEATQRRSTLRACRGVVVASQHMASEMTRNGVAPSRVHHVPLFSTAFTPDPTPPAPRPFSGRVLFVGRLTELKGWSHLLDALPQASDRLGRPMTLVVAGDGPDRAAFAARCAERRVPHEFHGWLTGARLSDQLRAADLLVVPSIWPEPFGLVGLEAACVGLPAVAYAVGGIPEWLVPGVTGELAAGDPPRAAALSDALVRALTQSDHWQRLRLGAWQRVGTFSVEAHVTRLIPILDRAASL